MNVPSGARSVRANAVAIALAQIAAKAAGFVTLLVLTRVLPLEDFGRYTLALAFAALLSPLADFGTDMHVTRLVAQGALPPGAALGASLTLKAGLALVVTAVALIAALVLGYAPPTPLLIALAALTVAAGTLGNSVFAILRAARRMDREAAGTIAGRLLHLAATLAAVALGTGVVGVAAAQLGAAVVALIAVGAFARGAAPAPVFAGARAHWAGLIRGGLPFALTAVVVTIYFRLDTVMLSLMQGERSTAVYGACANLLFASLLLSQALVTAVFPVVAESDRLDSERTRAVVRRALELSLAASLPLALLATAFARPGLVLLYGAEYGAGAAAMTVLAWTAPVLFVTNLCGHVLAASGRMREVLAISTVNAIVNVTLNLFLIPRFDAAGAAFATLVTELVGLAAFANLLRRERLWALSGRGLSRVAAAAALFAGVLAVLARASWPLPALLALAGAAYATLLFGLRVVSADDLRAFVRRAPAGEAA